VSGDASGSGSSDPASAAQAHRWQHALVWISQAFTEARALLRDSTVAVVPIENPLELYLFEAYCAMELGTGEWTTFQTHRGQE